MYRYAPTCKYLLKEIYIYMMYISPRSKRSSINIMPISWMRHVYLYLCTSCLCMIYLYIHFLWLKYIYIYMMYTSPRSRRSSMNIMPILNASCISMYLLYMHDISQYSFLVFIHMMQLSKCIECISIDRNNMSWKNGQPNTIDCKPWEWRGPRYVPTVALYR